MWENAGMAALELPPSCCLVRPTPMVAPFHLIPSLLPFLLFADHHGVLLVIFLKEPGKQYVLRSGGWRV